MILLMRRVLLKDIKGDSPSPDTPNPILPLPADFCENCALNGNYPWNRNPWLLCYWMGGGIPIFYLAQEDVVVQCPHYKPASEMWDAFIADRRREAAWNEESRKRSSLENPVWSSDLLPAEEVQSKDSIAY